MNKPHWTDEYRALWQRIAAHPFEAPGAALDFTRRLARDKSWSLDHARQAIEEYRRFCFLSVVQGTPVTPSEDVDEVWHQHLTYSRDYWDIWCGQVLGRRLHHDPTQGGASEARKFWEQYAQTLATYEAWFGPSPEAFWPDARKRFAPRPRFRTIDTERVIAIPRPRFPVRWAVGLLAAALCPATAMAQMANPLDWPAEPFLVLFVTGLVVALMITIWGRYLLRDTGASLMGRELSATETAYLAGGPSRAFATEMMQAMDGGRVAVDPKGVVTVDGGGRVRGMLADHLKDGAKYHDVRKAAQSPLLDVKHELEARGFLVGSSRAALSRLLPILFFAPVLVFGIAKIQIGSERGHPVGILTFLVGVGFVVALIAMLRRPTRSRAGDALLTQMRQDMSRLTRAPMGSELAMAVALGGAAVLVGTPYESLAAPSLRVDAGGSSGCGGGSSCGGGGGDGGGGGGCGGCSSS